MFEQFTHVEVTKDVPIQEELLSDVIALLEGRTEQGRSSPNRKVEERLSWVDIYVVTPFWAETRSDLFPERSINAFEEAGSRCDSSEFF